MTNYRTLEIDFIERTLALIDQYKKYAMPALRNSGKYDEQYEVTLLINCLLGTLVFPKEIGQRRLDKNWLGTDRVMDVLDEWGLEAADIRRAGASGLGKNAVSYERDTLTLSQLIRQMRNVVAHGRFEVSSQDGQISGVIFKQMYPSLKTKFEVHLPVDRLDRFVRKLTETMLEQIKAER